MPADGLVQAILYFNQAATAESPVSSAANWFAAYVLRPTGKPNEYSVLWDSGEQIIPQAKNLAGDLVSISVPNVAVTTGDVIAFYGEGIPFDLGSGTDGVSYTAPAAPAQGATIDLSSYALMSEARTYLFAATSSTSPR